MNSDVNVKIDLKKPTGKKVSGGVLILQIVGATIEELTKVNEYKEYKTLTDIATAGYTDTTAAYKAAALVLGQADSPDKVAMMKAKSVAEVISSGALLPAPSKNWRQLVVVTDETDKTVLETADVISIATYIETFDNAMYFSTVPTKTELATVAEKKFKRTLCFVHKEQTAVAAFAGEVAGNTAGSINYKNTPLSGIPTMDELDDGDITAIDEDNGITYITKAGVPVTSSGKVLSGEYADSIDGIDFVISQIEHDTQLLLINNKKIPYDNIGITMLQSVTVSALQRAYNQGIIATKDDGTPDYSATFALRADVDPTDIVERKYIGGAFSFRISSSVDNVLITGTVEY